MATPSYARSLVCAAKRLKISPPSSASLAHQTRALQHQSLPENIENELASLRLPRAVQATYLAPLRRQPTHSGTPTCDLQLRSYSVRNLEVFTDFALRAAYYLNLPASGPVPLPRITERWTVPRSVFVHKKSQENFERITARRLIQIQDGHPEVVSIWLAFLKKYQYYGVGMKANVWEHSGLEVAEDMEAEGKRLEARLGDTMALVGAREHEAGQWRRLKEVLMEQPFKAQWGAEAPMSGNQDVPHAGTRIQPRVVREGEAERRAERVGGEEGVFG
ncbi:mitochondrial 37S ribosomal protein rsm10 [Saxophila tyrrhenica]|uniref:Small ribosomal subunit protein uS10m n=1 Tax=Saxophila tyrrhenica TaxID=1690608 RepID=A0AAV9P1E4_9PEZI|nr:mitochondrial 37S ribosomal protein rsm10 [Saxophila tyrrhenica]